MNIKKSIPFFRISENKVCFTIDSKNAANLFMTKTIVVKNRKLLFKLMQPGRTVHKYKRFVLLNILPHIPNDIIIDHLEELGVSIKNGMRCSSSNKMRKHVQSHRHQFYVKGEDVDKVLTKIEVPYHSAQLWIYSGADDLKCNFCKNRGRIAAIL